VAEFNQEITEPPAVLVISWSERFAHQDGNVKVFLEESIRRFEDLTQERFRY